MGVLGVLHVRLLTVIDEMARRENAKPAASPNHELTPADTDCQERSCKPQRRPLAAFVAHLVATYLRLPQTCARRRRKADEATGAYDTAMSSSPVEPGHTISRSV